MARWKEQRFEAAVGAVNTDMRLALNARRELAEIAKSSGSERSKWFKIMGSRPLRTVVQGAFNLPPAFSRIDLDRQVSMLETRAERLLGSPTVSQLADPGKVETLIRRYLAAPSDAGAARNPSLLLLQAGGFGGGFFRRF